MLDFESLPPLPQRYTEFKALPDLRILGGMDLPTKTLITLFRYCKLLKFNHVFEFKLDKKVMNEVPSKTSACEDIQEVLRELEPLPPRMKKFLEHQNKLIVSYYERGGES